jgi:hypothetical protein
MPGKTQVHCQTAIAAPVEEVWAIVQDSTLLSADAQCTPYRDYHRPKQSSWRNPPV